MGSQSIGASALATVLPMITQDWFPLGLTGSIFMLSKDSQNPPTHSLKASILWHSAFFKVQLSHLYMTTGKIIALTIWTFVGKVISLLFNMLSRFVIAFLPKSKCLLISWLKSLSTSIYNSFFLISRTSQQLKNQSMHKFWYLHTMACVYAKSL